MKARNSEERAVSLTKMLITLPPAAKSLLYIIVFGFLTGLVIFALQGKTDLVSLAEGAGNGFFLISIPALLSAITTTLFKRELKLRRVIFLAFICSVVYALFYLALVRAHKPNQLAHVPSILKPQPRLELEVPFEKQKRASFGQTCPLSYQGWA